MPKEITHWIIAEEVSKRLKGTAFEKVVNNHKELVKFGSVLHDKLYYLSTGAKVQDEYIQHELEDVPSRMHGVNGEDTLDIIRAMQKSLYEIKEGKEELRALIVGVATHIFADITFHPMVYYYSGDYNDPDPERQFQARHDHYKIESLMDLYFGGGFGYILKNRLSSHLKPINYELHELVPQTFRHFINISLDTFSNYYSKAVTAALSGHNSMRRITLNTSVYPYRRFLPKKYQLLFGALYYKQLHQFLPLIKGNLDFKNPVTGENAQLSMRDLMEESVEKAVTFCKEAEGMLFGGAYEEIPHVGTSLEHGQIPGKVYEMGHFKPIFA